MKSDIRSRWVAGFGLALAAGHCGAATLASLEQFSSGVKGLEADFVQRVYDPSGEEIEASEGKLALAAPRQFRWEVTAPFPQLIVADGDQVFIYDPDLEQVTVRRQAHEEQRSPLAVLLDPALLKQDFTAKDAGKDDGLDWLELTPRKTEGDLERARLGFAGDALVAMDLLDAFGRRTAIRFDQWQRNPAFAPATFTFVIPAGVDVVGDPIQRAIITPLSDR